MVTTVASAAFGAVSGSSAVNAAVFTRIALPEMVRHGYQAGVGAAAIGAAGTLASLIPPSITVVIYAIVTGQSIGRLLLAGLFPGILTTVVYVVGIAVSVRLFKNWAPAPSARYGWKERFPGCGGCGRFSPFLYWLWAASSWGGPPHRQRVGSVPPVPF